MRAAAANDGRCRVPSRSKIGADPQRASPVPPNEIRNVSSHPRIEVGSISPSLIFAWVAHAVESVCVTLDERERGWRLVRAVAPLLTRQHYAFMLMFA